MRTGIFVPTPRLNSFIWNEETLIRDRHDLHVIRHAADQDRELKPNAGGAVCSCEKQQDDHDGLINLIGDRINASAPFSSFARACLRQQGNRGWNTELLMTS